MLVSEERGVVKWATCWDRMYTCTQATYSNGDGTASLHVPPALRTHCPIPNNLCLLSVYPGPALYIYYEVLL